MEHHGHLSVSRNTNPILFNFCGNTRKARQDAKLSVECAAAMNAIEFDWQPCKKRCAQDNRKASQSPVEAGALLATDKANEACVMEFVDSVVDEICCEPEDKYIQTYPV